MEQKKIKEQKKVGNITEWFDTVNVLHKRGTWSITKSVLSVSLCEHTGDSDTELRRASNAAVGSVSRRRVNKSGRGAISQPPPSFICFGLMSLALKAYSAQATGSETLQLSFVRLYAFMWRAGKSEQGNTITGNVKSVRACLGV